MIQQELTAYLVLDHKGFFVDLVMFLNFGFFHRDPIYTLPMVVIQQIQQEAHSLFGLGPQRISNSLPYLLPSHQNIHISYLTQGFYRFYILGQCSLHFTRKGVELVFDGEI